MNEEPLVRDRHLLKAEFNSRNSTKLRRKVSNGAIRRRLVEFLLFISICLTKSDPTNAENRVKVNPARETKFFRSKSS